jgi:hypothetical protein
LPRVWTLLGETNGSSEGARYCRLPLVKQHAVRTDDGDLQPGEAQRPFPFRVREALGIGEHPCSATSEFGSVGNNRSSLLKFCVDVALPARSPDPNIRGERSPEAFRQMDSARESGGDLFRDSHTPHSLAEVVSVDLVVVSEQVAGCRRLRESFQHRLPCPPRRGMLRYAQMNDASAVLC